MNVRNLANAGHIPAIRMVARVADRADFDATRVVWDDFFQAKWAAVFFFANQTDSGILRFWRSYSTGALDLNPDSLFLRAVYCWEARC